MIRSQEFLNDADKDNIKSTYFQNFARYFHFVDDEHIRIVNAEGLDCLVKWRTMTVVSYSKFLNLKESFKGTNAHPLIDTNPTNATWHTKVRFIRRNHDIQWTQDYEMYK